MKNENEMYFQQTTPNRSKKLFFDLYLLTENS